MTETFHTCSGCGGRVLDYSLCPRCEPLTADEEQRRVARELEQLDHPPSRDEYDRIMGW